MPFVRSVDDIRRLQAIARRPTFTGLRSIAATFRTDAEVVRRLLPPPLERVDPVARVWVAEIATSNVAGGFVGAGLDLAARHGDTTGWYCLFMPMSTDTAVQVGRETLGEPKKLCDITLTKESDRVRGTVARRGVTLLTAEVEPTTELGPMEQEDVAFHFKYLLACNGDGYDAPPQLIHATHRLAARHVAVGTATVALASSAHDCLAEVPVLEVLSGMYAEGEDVVEARVACAVDGDAFLPWAYGNTDDWFVFAEVQKRAHALDRRASRA